MDAAPRNKIEIKRIKPSGFSWVVPLFDQYRVFYGQPSDIDRAQQFIRSRLDNHESVIFVAFEKGKDKAIPVGFIQLYPKYSSVRTVRNWILNDLYVDKAHRKRGIGESLIRTALAFAKKNDAKFVELSTAVDNYIAQRLYEAVGFEQQPPENDFLTYRIILE